MISLALSLTLRLHLSRTLPSLPPFLSFPPLLSPRLSLEQHTRFEMCPSQHHTTPSYSPVRIKSRNPRMKVQFDQHGVFFERLYISNSHILYYILIPITPDSRIHQPQQPWKLSLLIIELASMNALPLLFMQISLISLACWRVPIPNNGLKPNILTSAQHLFSDHRLAPQRSHVTWMKDSQWPASHHHIPTTTKAHLPTLSNQSSLNHPRNILRRGDPHRRRRRQYRRPAHQPLLHIPPHKLLHGLRIIQLRERHIRHGDIQHLAERLPAVTNVEEEQLLLGHYLLQVLDVAIVCHAAGAFGFSGTEVEFAEAAVVHGVVEAAEHAEGGDWGEDPGEDGEVAVFDLGSVSGWWKGLRWYELTIGAIDAHHLSGSRTVVTTFASG